MNREWWDDDEWLDEPDYERCELDHPDGGVCLRRLRRDGTCPDEERHAEARS